MNRTAARLAPPAVVLLALASVYFASESSDRPRAALPVAVAERIDPRDCGDCHPGIVESLREAPHSLTLRRPDENGLAARFAGRNFPVDDREFRFEQQPAGLHFFSSGRAESARVDWIFGSGHHALTPVATFPGVNGDTELIQLHVSWFADGELGVTPGSETLIAGSATFGIHHGAQETRDCFTCHASFVPSTAGAIDLSRLQPGVLCSRCHQQSATHRQSEGAVRTTPAWSELSARDSIRRCGECHRRSDQFTADELTTDNRLLIRFAPVGMELSPCFRANDDPRFAGQLPRFDCLSCHDPHQPASADPRHYVARCAACHDDGHPGLRNCSIEPQGTRCLECHMPAVQVLDHLSFTDHWIRIRKDAAAGPAASPQTVDK